MSDTINAPGGRKPEYLVPAVIAGSVAGVLAAIPFLSCLCCLWIIGGAVMAARLLSRETDATLTAGDGAIVGALTGIAAAVVVTVLFEMTPLGRVSTNFFLKVVERWAAASGQTIPQLEDLKQLQTRTGFSLPGMVVDMLLSSVAFAFLGVIGGAIGVSLFGRKRPPVLPQQPPQGPSDATA